jgi:hypothetical protein
MKLRTHLLAGLLATVPTLASAAPYVGIGELQQRAELGLGTGSGAARTPEFFQRHQQAMAVGVSHIEASEQATRALGASTTAAHDEGWSLRHKQQMDQGVSHIDASFAASRAE